MDERDELKAGSTAFLDLILRRKKEKGHKVRSLDVCLALFRLGKSSSKKN